MNTLAALLSKLQVKTVTPEIQALCAIMDAHRFHIDADLANAEARLDVLERKAGVGKPGSLAFEAEQG